MEVGLSIREKEILDMLNAGKTYQEIGDYLGITRQRVHQILRRPLYSRASNLHERAVTKLGGKCVKCGFSDVRALQIDHVNGGGGKEIRSIGVKKMYSLAIRDSEHKYQLLCANCNWIKRHENKESTQRESRLAPLPQL
jgi:hypothetical protein